MSHNINTARRYRLFFNIIRPFYIGQERHSDKTTALSSTTSSVSTNNNNNNNNNKTSVALNALELKNGTYRWQNTSQQINPTLRLIAHTDYLIKIKNPTDVQA